jgi:ribulose-bisphosphate carboxylase large chain
MLADPRDRQSMEARLTAIYHVRSDAAAIAARARAIAVEQSVEMPLDAIDDETILAGIVGRVEAIRDLGGGVFEVRIALAVATTGCEAGQLVNMLFGNTSLQDDATLHDVDLPAGLAGAFGGPGFGVAGLRGRQAVGQRALTCGALKPQGLPPAALASLARRMAEGGVDFIKDDHGLADQAYSPFAARVELIAAALRDVGGRSRYVPSLSGNLDQLRAQIRVALDEGIDTFMAAPMIIGLPTFAALVRETKRAAFFAHPSMSGVARIAPPLLYGKLFRLFGADALIFPNHGGRFGYSAGTCRALAEAARAPWHGVLPSMPVPAGGMVPARVPEMLEFYGPDTILLIGGALLAAGPRLTAEVAAFVAAVEQHDRITE